MAIRRIVTYGTPILRQRTQEVANLNGDLQQLIDDMAATMYAAPGVGLAANQVGSPHRLFVANPSEDRDPAKLLVVINPEVVESDGEFVSRGGVSVRPGFPGGGPAGAPRPVARARPGGPADRSRGPRPPRANLPARDGSPERPVLRGPPQPRQARHPGPEAQESLPRAQRLSGPAFAIRLFRHGSSRRADGRGRQSLSSTLGPVRPRRICWARDVSDRNATGRGEARSGQAGADPLAEEGIGKPVFPVRLDEDLFLQE